MANIIYMTKTAWQNLLTSIKTKAGYVGTLTASQAKTVVDSIQTGGGSVSISQPAYLFYSGYRKNEMSDLLQIISSSATDAQYMFYNFPPTNNRIDLTGFNMTNITNMRNFMDDVGALQTLVFPALTPTGSVNMMYAFNACTSLTSLDLSGWEINNVEGMCNNCQNLRSIDFTGSRIHGSSIVCRNTFKNCIKLETLDLSTWEIGTNRDQRNLFGGCSNLNTVKLGSGWEEFGYFVLNNNTSCFYGCTNMKTLIVDRATPPTLSTVLALESSAGVCPLEHIYVPAGSVETYKTATNWSYYEDIISAVPQENNS